jgi:hypothetical protein
VAQILVHFCVRLFFKAAPAHSHDGDNSGNAACRRSPKPSCGSGSIAGANQCLAGADGEAHAASWVGTELQAQFYVLSKAFGAVPADGASVKSDTGKMA